MAGENLYVILPGSVTGDLWHVAAAQILSGTYSKEHPNVVVVMAINPLIKKDYGGDVKNAEAETEKKHAKINYDYFQSIGLKCMLLQVDYSIDKKGDGTANKDIEKIMWKQPNTYKLSDRVLKLMTATTITINLLTGLKVGEAEERMACFSSKMFGIPDKEDGQVGVDPELDRVVLENYRVGHVNGGMDSNLEMSKWFKNEAEKKGMAVIYVIVIDMTQERGREAYSKLEATKGNVLFDLDNKNDPVQQGWPGLDSRAQALFWAKVTSNKDIAGVFSGRSGSVDVAGFNGVNVFFWDEPFIRRATGPLAPVLSTDKDYKDLDNAMGADASNSRDAANGRIAQCFRSLQLLPIMAVACPVDPIFERKDEKGASIPFGKDKKGQPIRNWTKRRSLDWYRQTVMEHLPLDIISKVFQDVPEYQCAKVSGRVADGWDKE
ncbi:hypothetical protein M501DRAFT_1013859 [Patellaria atrata CBS 101060]|uniref:Uncharacterized protein n=1 Tax=Patellaria atrata CBS 101060 TaxID=1346257 RepID=A0A9P4SGJ5_9PEZI|nr:hypothetical protein M501DRAFT_1013859 [Patellaria atrata CBS 101060]